MKLFILFLSFLVSCHIGVDAQTSSAPKLPTKLVRTSTAKVHIPENDPGYILLKMDFNGAISRSRLSKLKIEDIESISLAYSRYKLSDMFDQLTLNARRMDQLYAHIPGLKNNPWIQWYWVEQTGCETPDACGDYFHGFIIKLRNVGDGSERIPTDKEWFDHYTKIYDSITEVNHMDTSELLSTGRLVRTCDTTDQKTLIKGNRLSRIKGWDVDNNRKLMKLLKEELKDSGIVQLELLMDTKGKLVSIDNIENFERAVKISKLLDKHLSVTPARYMDKKIETSVIVTISIQGAALKVDMMQQPILPNGEVFVLDKFLYHESRRISCEYRDTSAKPVPDPFYSAEDIILKVLDRNRQWKNCLVATDVTGSMNPYLAQFKVWHKLNLSANAGNHDFVFFNDGDAAPDFLKEKGKVGGIYYLKTAAYDSLSEVLTTAQYNGNGGDLPENNIEAVIEGLKKNPSCTEVIMIADNNATPRDLELLGKVRVPIRLVLCGAGSGINTAYLDMVRKNRGSIHTMEQDLYDLAKISELQEFEIDGNMYRLQNGKFYMLPKKVITTTALSD